MILKKGIKYERTRQLSFQGIISLIIREEKQLSYLYSLIKNILGKVKGLYNEKDV